MGASVRPETQGSRIERNIAAMREQGADDNDIEAYLTQEGLTPEPSPALPKRTAPAADASAFRAPGAPKSGDLGAALRDPKGTARAAFEFGAVGPLVAAQAIPGMEAFQAAAGSVGSKFTDKPMGYRESLDALRSQTEGLPWQLKAAAQLPAAAGLLPKAAFSTIPKAMATSGGVGAAHGLAQADPDVGIGERVTDAAVQGGAAAGLTGLLGGGIRAVEKVGKLAKLRSRINKADDFDESAVARDKEITAATKENYGAAAAEGEITPTSPVLQKALERPLIKKYADMIRGEGEGPMSDADLARAVYRRMSEARLGHKSSMDRLGYSDDRAAEVRQLARELKTLKEATASASQKPPITLEVAGERTVVEPRITPGREPKTGPVSAQNLSAYTTAPKSTLTGFQEKWKDVPHSVSEKDGVITLSKVVVPEGQRGQGIGTAFMDDLVKYADETGQRIALTPSKDFGASSVARLDRFYKQFGFEKNAGRSRDLSVSESRLRRPGESETAQMQGPGGPAFQLRGDPGKVTPGVEIETPAMRVQTAPAEDVPAVMPSFPRAVAEKARMEGEREAASEAADMASRVARGLRSPPKKAHFKSPAAFLDKIKSGEVPPNEIEAALPAFLSGAKRDIEFSASPWAAAAGAAPGAIFGGPAGGIVGSVVAPAVQGVVRTAGRLNRLSPFVDALDLQAGNAVRQPLELQELLRALGLATAVTP